jgi:hypothetical protein
MASAIVPHPRALVTLGPHGGAHRVAIRAGLSMAIPLVFLWATGHLELSLYTAFGAFTALYGRGHSHLTRLRMQSTAGATLIAAVVLGALVATSDLRDVLVVPVVAVAAGCTALLSDALDWHPPGPLFVVFAVAACASVPSEPATIVTAFLAATCSAALSLGIGAAGSILPRARRAARTELRTSFRQALTRPGQASAVARLVVGVFVAGLIPTVSGLGHPYWAMVAVVAALGGVDAPSRLVRATHRILGTLLGVGLAAGLFALHLPALATILVVVALQMGAELFIGRNYGVTMVFVTPLALCMVELAHAVDGETLIVDRTVETLLGALVGIALTLAWQARGARPAEVSAA